MRQQWATLHTRNCPRAAAPPVLPRSWCVGDYCAIDAEGGSPKSPKKKKKKKGSLGESFAVVRSSPKVRDRRPRASNAAGPCAAKQQPTRRVCCTPLAGWRRPLEEHA